MSVPAPRYDVEAKHEFLLEQIRALKDKLNQIGSIGQSPAMSVAVGELHFIADTIFQAACDLQPDRPSTRST
jgi:hypothetical protein